MRYPARSRQPDPVGGLQHSQGSGKQYSTVRTEIESLLRAESAVGRDSGRRADRRRRSCCRDRRLEGIQPGAWFGCLDRVGAEHTTGGKDKPGSITKQGNRYLRWLLVAGAMVVIRYAQKHGTKKRPWLGRLMERRPTKVVAVALANKMVQITWAIMIHGERYKELELLLAA